MKKVESRAFFNVGVLQYKKKRGMQITGSSKMDFLICPLDITAGTKGLFIKNPFICMDNEEYNSAIFEENDKSFSKEDFEQFYKDYYLNGISKLGIYIFGKANNQLEESVPAEFADKITIRSAENLL